jgi:H+/Cl- antiporter ClcA
MAWLSRRWFPGTQGSGIPQAIAASLSDDGPFRQRLLSLKIAVAKVVVLTLGGLVAGASARTWPQSSTTAGHPGRGTSYPRQVGLRKV